MNTTACGFVASGYEQVADEFQKAFVGNPTMGAALAIRVDGTPVVDLWGGVADARTQRPWQENTASVVFSCTKGLSAILAARLVQDGHLDYQAPVARYWPEFAAMGKEATTITDLLAHRAGLSAPRVDLTVDDVVDWQRMALVLQGQRPLWEPGTAHGYHAITHGWLIGQVIRTVTGASVGEYFHELIAGPLNADAWIGLPEEERDRIAHQTVGQTLADLVADQSAARDLTGPDWLDRAMTLGGAFSATLVGENSGFNDYRLQAAQIPGAGGVATARALAAIWSATVTETDGVQLLSRATTDAATHVQSEGTPVFATEDGPFARWGMGFQLDSGARRYLTPQGFGHDGAGGQVAFAEPDLKVGFAFTTNLMEARDSRGTDIVDALRHTLSS
jgi:CubicO group peptidase (beta-lactamase class C family)